MNADTWTSVLSSLRFDHDPASAILERAAEVLERNHWLQGASAARYRGDDLMRLDVIGALLVSTGFNLREAHIGHGDGRSHSGITRSNYEVWSRTVTRSARQGFIRCCDYIGQVTGYLDVEYWNDEIAHSKDHVAEVLREAAVLAIRVGD